MNEYSNYLKKTLKFYFKTLDENKGIESWGALLRGMMYQVWSTVYCLKKLKNKKQTK